MLKILLLVALIFATCPMFSCHYSCSRATLVFGLVGLSDAEADSILIRRFEKNTRTISDSFLVDNISYSRISVTLKMVAFPSSVLLEPA